MSDDNLQKAKEPPQSVPPATERQKEYARTLGIEFSDDVNIREISKLIGAAVEKRDEERWGKLDALDARENEIREQIRNEALAEIDEDDCRLSKATITQMIEELETRGVGAILISFRLDDVEDYERMSGVSVTMSFSDDMDEENARSVLIALGYDMLQGRLET